MNKKIIVESVAKRVEDRFDSETSGHGWHHIDRVWQISKKIALQENKKVDMLVVELAALLHDIADHKFVKDCDVVAKKEIQSLLKEFNLEEEIINKVVNIVCKVSFSKSKGSQNIDSLEGQIVQDADRLDALGAIGIARAFAYGGSQKRRMYDPNEDLKSVNSTSSVAHFYQKLLKLRDLMNTKTAKKMAAKRHQFLELFLNQFYKEWRVETQ